MLRCLCLDVIVLTALLSGVSYAQKVETIGYLVTEPIHIGTSEIQVHSVRIYGSQEALTDLLLRSSLIDCNCPLLNPADCKLSQPRVSVPNCFQLGDLYAYPQLFWAVP